MTDLSRRSFFRNGLLAGSSLMLPEHITQPHVDQKKINDLSVTIAEESALSYPGKVLNLQPAQWLWFPSQRTLQNTIVLFRHQIDIRKGLASAKGWVLGDSRYKLYCNGKRIQFGPAPSDPRWPEADPFDVLSFLQEGNNVIGVEVLYFGTGDGTWPIGKPGLILKMDLTYSDRSSDTISTDDNWLCRIPRSWTPGRYKRWYLRAFQEEFDARQYPYGWHTNQFTDLSEWVKAKVISTLSDKPSLASSYPEYQYDVGSSDPGRLELRHRSIRLMKEEIIPVKQLVESFLLHWKKDPQEYFEFNTPDAFSRGGELAVKETSKDNWEFNLASGQSATLCFEMAEQHVGFPVFTIEAPDGTIVELLVHEAHRPGTDLLLNTHFNSWSRFICKSGTNHFETFDFECYRWMQLHIRNSKGRIRISKTGMRRRLYSWQNEPHVICNDEKVQKVVMASINTLYNCAQETLVDGMGRERQQYSGDGSHQIHAIHMAMGEPAMSARFINTFSQGMTTEGFFLDAWPAYDRLARLLERQIQLTTWGPLLDHGIGFNFDNYYHYLYTGDPQPIREAYPRLLRFFDYLNSITGPDGLLPVENIGIPAVWIDHIAYKAQKHKQCAFNLYAAAMMKVALPTLCRSNGDEAKAKIVEQKSKSIISATVKKFWDTNQKIFVDNLPWRAEENETRLSDRSLATAILFDLCPGGDITASAKALTDLPPEMGTSYPTNMIWAYWALAKIGRTDKIISDIRGRWYEMESVHLNNTIAEDWHAKPDSNSQWSHCAVSALFLMHQAVAGINCLKPGFSEIEIAPQLGGLEKLSLTTHTMKGPIHTELELINNKLKVKLDIPEGIKGSFKWEGRKRTLQPGKQEFIA